MRARSVQHEVLVVVVVVTQVGVETILADLLHKRPPGEEVLVVIDGLATQKSV